MYGSSTGCPPIQVKTKKLPTKNQKNILLKGRNLNPLNLDLSIKGKTNNTNILNTKATTPPNLFGIERNIA